VNQLTRDRTPITARFLSTVMLVSLSAGCDRAPGTARQEPSGPGIPTSAEALANYPQPPPGGVRAFPNGDKPKAFSNSIGIEFVLIPAGEFVRGSPHDDLDRFSDEWREKVSIRDEFYLGRHEVTRGQFAQFVAAENYVTDGERDPRGCWGFDAIADNLGEGLDGPDPKYNWRNPGFVKADDHPVENVSWNDAQAFCRWLSTKEGRTYRLPTEMEWEYACRAGTTTTFANGDDSDLLGEIGNIRDQAYDARVRDRRINGIAANDGYVFTAPVGRFKPNHFGLYDMVGNVSEWCDNWFIQNKGDPTPLTFPSGPQRAVRGSSWTSQYAQARSADRSFGTPHECVLFRGFRVALFP
jgi:formylglycine-generating enzyme required for sulfatase activity